MIVITVLFNLQIIPELDAVVISHPDLEHMGFLSLFCEHYLVLRTEGALPYAIRHMNLRAPIYCTKPVKVLCFNISFERS